MSKIVIKVANLVKYFENFCAVDDISLEVQQGEIYGFLGTNGAGKTTTIRCLTGLLAPTGGQIEILGRPLNTELKSQIGVVSEQQSLYNDLTVYQNIDFFRELYQLDPRQTDHIIEQLDLIDKKKTKVSKLSKGLRQRVLLARSIIHSPKILFLDEPSSGLDPISAQKVYQFIKEMRERGTTIFLTTHYMEEADWLCDQVSFIDKGRLVKSGLPAQLKREMGSEQLEIIYQAESTQKLVLWPMEPGVFERLCHFEKDHQIISVKTVTPSMRDIFLSLREEA